MSDKTPSTRSTLGDFLFGNGCMLVASILWGVNVAATKALIPEWMTADSITVVRLVGGCILFWITSAFIKCDRIQKGDWGRIILGGAVGLFAFIYLFVTSLRFGSAIDISIIMTLPPMFVILIGVIFEGQRPSLIECAGIVISFAGAAVVILAGGGNAGAARNALIGDGLAVLSTICYAFYLVILEKPSHTYRPLSLLRWVFLFAALPALFIAPGMERLPILHTREIAPWSEIAFILLGPTFIAYFLVQPAIKTIGSELASLYQYLLPVFAAISAVLMGIEKLVWTQVAAMVVIIAGMAMTNIGKKRRAAGVKKP